LVIGNSDSVNSSIYVPCTTKQCHYPAAHRTTSGNKNGRYSKCILHSQKWYPKLPTQKGHFLLGHQFLRPQLSPSLQSSSSLVSSSANQQQQQPPPPQPQQQPAVQPDASINSNNNNKQRKVPQLPPCCWHCCCNDEYCKGIGYTPYSRSIPATPAYVMDTVLQLYGHNIDSNKQEQMKKCPKNYSLAPWHFHPSVRTLDEHDGRWKFKTNRFQSNIHVGTVRCGWERRIGSISTRYYDYYYYDYY